MSDNKIILLEIELKYKNKEIKMFENHIKKLNQMIDKKWK